MFASAFPIIVNSKNTLQLIQRAHTQHFYGNSFKCVDVILYPVDILNASYPYIFREENYYDMAVY